MRIFEPLILTPDGALLVLSKGPLEGMSLLTWDFANGREPVSRANISRSDDLWPHAVGLADDGKSILVITRQSQLHGWDLASNKVKDVPQPQLADRDSPQGLNHFPVNLKSAVFLSGGKKLAAIVHFGRLQMIDIATGKELFASEPGDRVIASPDERLLAITDSPPGDKMMRVRDVGNRAPQLVGEFYSESGVIKLVDAATGKETARTWWRGARSGRWPSAPDGKTLAATTGWETGRIHFIDVASGKETRTIETPPLRSPALAFTPDGSRLVSGMADGSILVWDVRAAR